MTDDKDKPVRVIIEPQPYPEWIKYFWYVSIGMSILVLLNMLMM